MRTILLTLLWVAGFVCSGQPAVVIQNCRVVDVREEKIMSPMTIVIKGDVISWVGPARKFKTIPDNALVIDASGKYVMPGLTDGHIHFFQSGGLYTRPDAIDLTHRVPYADERRFTFENTTDYLRRYLRLGITTVVDAGGPFSNFVIRDSIAAHHVAPRVVATGPLFSMVDRRKLELNDPPIIRTTTVSAVDSLFDRLITYRPDFIKIWYIVTPSLPAEQTLPVVHHIARRAREKNLPLAVHATQLSTATFAVEAGANILVHSVDNEIIPDSFVKMLKEKNVTYIPTLTVYNGYMKTFTGRINHHPNDLAWANPFVYGSLLDLEVIPEKELPPMLVRMRKGGPRRSRGLDSLMAINLRKIADGGVNIVAGTDAGNIGTMHASSYYPELEAMQRAGLTHGQILRAATVNAAKAFKLNTGLVEAGKAADLIVLGGNPLETLSAVKDPTLVIRAGKVMAADTLVQETPEMIVQRQLNAYNARNMEAFLDTYTDDVELYNYPDTRTIQGKAAMKEAYSFFDTVPYLHAEIKERITLGNKVIDHERVRFGDNVVEAVAIYEVKDGKIFKVTFVR